MPLGYTTVKIQWWVNIIHDQHGSQVYMFNVKQERRCVNDYISWNGIIKNKMYDVLNSKPILVQATTHMHLEIKRKITLIYLVIKWKVPNDNMWRFRFQESKRREEMRGNVSQLMVSNKTYWDYLPFYLDCTRAC